MATPRIFLLCLIALVAPLARGATDEIKLTLANSLAIPRVAEPVTAGVPLPRGFVGSADPLTLLGPDGRAVPVQVLVASRFKDGSPRCVYQPRRKPATAIVTAAKGKTIVVIRRRISQVPFVAGRESRLV